MFETFRIPPADSILALSVAYRQDSRPHKIDLGIGVYKDSLGATPVMRAVKSAENQLLQLETTKAYLPPVGDEAFLAGLAKVNLGDSVPHERVASIQTVGGGAAVRVLCDLLADEAERTLWIPNPSWINHGPMAKAAGLAVREYRYLDTQTSEVAFDAMIDDLKAAQPGDIVLLHGCCHNPSGADLSMAQWQEVTRLILAAGLLPFVDIAYQGFGDGLEADAQGLRHMAAAVPELLLSVSCSKNFGIYRDRVGAAFILAQTTEAALRAKALFLAKSRVSYSFAPNHGAATVGLILGSAELTADWKVELEQMRRRMLDNRQTFSTALSNTTQSDRFNFITRHKGMFSLLPLRLDQITRLRDDFAIFMPPDGRMNIAALQEDAIESIARAIAEV